MYCNKCGNQLSGYGSFCGKCGNPRKVSISERKPEEQILKTSEMTGNSIVAATAGYKVIIAGIALVAIVAFVYVGINVLSGNQNGTSNKTTSSDIKQTVASDNKTGSGNKQNNVSNNTQSQTQKATEAEPKISKDKIDEETLRNLLDKNIEYYWHWQSLGMSTTNVCLDGDFYQVDTSYFKTWSELEKAISEVYCEAETNKLLYSDINNWVNTPLYKNFDGKIGKNINFMSDRGHYVSWENYRVEIDSVKNGECEFSVILKSDYPGKANQDNVPIKQKAVFENGNWKLIDMFFDGYEE